MKDLTRKNTESTATKAKKKTRRQANDRQWVTTPFDGLVHATYQLAELLNDDHTDHERLYQFIHNAVQRLFYFENMYVVTCSDKGEHLSIPFFFDKSNPVATEVINKAILEEDLQQSFIATILHEQRSLSLDSIKAKQMQKEGYYPYLEREFQSWIGVPIASKKTLFGALVIHHKRPCQFQVNDILHFLEHVGTALGNFFQQQKTTLAWLYEKRAFAAARQNLEQQIKARTEEIVASNRVLEQQIIERIKIEEKLKHDAFHDALTDLPNRALFIDRLNHCILSKKRHSSEDFAVFFLDLDRFKTINDSLGHVIGDKLLEEVSQRLLACVRPDDTVARVGGDEFCILLVKIDSPDIMHRVADRILKAFKQTFIINGNNIISSTSIGITTSRQGYVQAEEAIRDADAALYHAKSDGRNCYSLFDDSMHRRVTRRLQIETLLREAIKNQEIYLEFQPILDIDSENIILFESLARWHSPIIGPVSPNEFIPVAEEIGVIAELGEIILELSMVALASWNKPDYQGKPIGVSVNLSCGQFSESELPDFILNLIDKYQLAHELLYLEITESLLIDNFETANNMLNDLHSYHINILLDDFGTGYSSLSYLHYFPIDIIKIDRSFVSQLENIKNKGIIQSIKALASDLHMKVIAEGIEQEEQVQYLKQIGCEYVQGYYYARPMSLEKAADFIERIHQA